MEVIAVGIFLFFFNRYAAPSAAAASGYPAVGTGKIWMRIPVVCNK